MASAFLGGRLVRAFVAFGLVGVSGLPAPAAALIMVGSLDTPGEALDVEVTGGLAWVADGPSGLRVLDVSNARSPAELGALDTPGSARAVVERNGIAYVADDSSGLRVIDVSEVSTPEELGALDTPGRALGVSVVGELAYVADGSSGLRVIDVSDPESPVELGFLDTPGDADGIAVVGALAFVADGGSGLRIVNVSDATAPFEVGALDTTGFARAVEVVGDLAYVADGAGGLRVIDVSDPKNPFERGSWPTPYDASGVAVVGGLAFLTDLSVGLRVLDVSDPAAPLARGGLSTQLAAGVEVANGIVYVADTYAGLRLIDASNPAAPVEIGAVDTPGIAFDLEVVDFIAYVADYDSGLRVIDVSNPTAPVEIGALDTPGYAYQVEVVGERAYLADGPSGLRVIDVSDPSAPVELGSFDTPGDTRGVEVVEGIAYLADGGSGLRLVDASNPAAPVELGVYDTPAFVHDVDVEEGLAYIADARCGLRIVDVSNPSRLVETYPAGCLSSPSRYFAEGVEVADGVAYVLWNDSIRLVDVSLPEYPAQLATVGCTLGSVAVVGPILWAANRALCLFDVSKITEPVLLGLVESSPVPGSLWAEAVVVRDTLAYVASRGSGLHILDFGPEYLPPPTTEHLVDSDVDAPDAVPGDGVCSTAASAEPSVCTLRAAIMEANALRGPDIVRLPPGGYALSIASSGGDDAATGDLDVDTSLTLVGTGDFAWQTYIFPDAPHRVIEIAEGARVQMSRLTIESGDDSAPGGGIANAGRLTLSNCNVITNRSESLGGAIYNTQTLLLEDTYVESNSASGDGGGIANDGGGVVIEGGAVRRNVSEGGSGGGVWSLGRVRLNGVGLEFNEAPRGLGGGLYNDSVLRATDSSFEGNEAYVGGAIANLAESHLIGVTLARNKAALEGGAIENEGYLEATNTTLSGNTARFGAGIDNFGEYARVVLEHATITGNEAVGLAGGGVCNGPGNVFATHTIIAANAPGGDCGCGAPLDSEGFNLDGDGSCGLDPLDGDLVGVSDPGLGPLQDNGGPTLTHALLPGSPAIDAGQTDGCAALDQRGVERPRDGDGDGTPLCDVGAVEFVPEPGGLVLFAVALGALQLCAAMSSRRTPGAPSSPGSAISRRPASIEWVATRASRTPSARRRASALIRSGGISTAATKRASSA